jgi:hypothetical protein
MATRHRDSVKRTPAEKGSRLFIAAEQQRLLHKAEEGRATAQQRRTENDSEEGQSSALTDDE